MKLAVANGVIQGVCSHSFKKHLRHRWTGFDLPISEPGILDAAHQTLSKAFRMLCELHGSASVALISDTARAPRN